MQNADDNDNKKLVTFYHDESIYNINEGQAWMWGEKEHPVLLPKTKGSGIMVAEFVHEHKGYLAFNAEEHNMAKARFPCIPKTA